VQSFYVDNQDKDVFILHSKIKASFFWNYYWWIRKKSKDYLYLDWRGLGGGEIWLFTKLSLL